MMGFLKCPRSSWASKLDAHPLSFFLSFHTLIALVHPLHGNPYSLTLMSIDGHLHSTLIRLVDVRLSSPFCLLHITPLIIFYYTHNAISMAHTHVLREDWKGLRTSKVWNNCLACHWGCAWLNTLCDENRATARLSDFVGITFFNHAILRRHDCFNLYASSIITFMSILNFCFESYGSEHSCHNEEKLHG